MFKRACNCGDEGLSTLLLQVQSPVSGERLESFERVYLCISLSSSSKDRVEKVYTYALQLKKYLDYTYMIYNCL